MRLTKQRFINRFSAAEMAVILTAAKSSVAVEAWLFRFDHITPDADGTSVDLCDASTQTGVQALEAAGLLGAGRAAEILGRAQTVGVFSTGQRVRVLTPFTAGWPDVYTIAGFDLEGSSIMIGEGGSFAPEYLEVV